MDEWLSRSHSKKLIIFSQNIHIVQIKTNILKQKAKCKREMTEFNF